MNCAATGMPATGPSVPRMSLSISLPIVVRPIITLTPNSIQRTDQSYLLKFAERAIAVRFTGYFIAQQDGRRDG